MGSALSRLGVGLLSGAAIAFQLLLVRSFSIAQWHHFAYMVISLALLGYAASGALLTLWRRPLLARLDTALPGLAGLFAVLAPGCFAVAQRLPVNPLEVMWDPRQLLLWATVYCLLALPFLCAGGAVALALAESVGAQHRIYRADLMGAAAGTVSVLAGLYALEVGTCLRFVSIAGGVAAGCFWIGRRRSWAPSAVAVAALAAAVAWPTAWLEPRPSEYKPLSKVLETPGATVVARRSSPLGSLAAVASPRIPFRIAPGASLAYSGDFPEQIVLFSDGAVAGVVDRAAESGAESPYLDRLPEALPFRLRPDAGRVALLGVGPGPVLDLALRYGSVVDAVDLDRGIAALVDEDLAAFTGGRYADARLRRHALDLRGFLAARSGPFDLVFLPAVDTGGAPGALALRESYAHTVEAFAETIGRLAPGGLLAVASELDAPPRVGIKLLATAIAALEASDLEPSGRLAAIRSWNRLLVLVARRGLDHREIETLRAFCAERSFDLVYYPGMREAEANRYNLLDEPVLHRAIVALLGPERSGFLRAYKFHVAPATDERPYLFRTFRWTSLPELLRLRARGGAALIEWSYLLLLATLLQALVAGILLILAPLWPLRRRSTDGAGRVGLYFACLGLGFLFLEIAFIQRLTLFLAHPLLATGVVLGGFLFFAGLGSGASRWLEKRWRRTPMGLTAGAILLSALAAIALSEALRSHGAGWPPGLKAPLALLTIAPLGFFLGVPFPLGLRRVATERPELVPWVWGVNGWASVLSAVLALLLAVHFGFTVLVAIACALYVTAALAAPRLVYTLVAVTLLAAPLAADDSRWYVAATAGQAGVDREFGPRDNRWQVDEDDALASIELVEYESSELVDAVSLGASWRF